MSFTAELLIGFALISVYFCLLPVAIGDIRERKKRPARFIVALLICCILHITVQIISDRIDGIAEYRILQYVLCIAYPLLGDLELFFYIYFFAETCGVDATTKNQIKLFGKVLLFLNILPLCFVPMGLIFTVDADGVYSRGMLYPAMYIFILIGLVVPAVLSLFIKMPARRRIAFILYGLLPIFAGVLMLFVSGITILNCITAMISMVMLFAYVYDEERRTLLQNETQLGKMQTEIALNRVQPSFIGNTLATVSDLCETSPRDAQTLSEDFSEYLQKGLFLAKEEKLSTFAAELEYAKLYLKIEKAHLGDKLNVKYDIKETDFSLPPLSLQPLVENAVIHGISKRADGGTVSIFSYSQGNAYYVVIADDGVGFRKDSVKPAAEHFGLSTTTERVRIMQNGEVTVRSTPGNGTEVIIRIDGTANT